MGCTLAIIFTKEHCKADKDKKQPEELSNIEIIYLTRLNIYNETGGDIQKEDMVSLFKTLNKSKTDALELKGFQEDVLTYLLGNIFYS